MDVFTFPLGPLETNCFLAVSGDKALAVDVGGDPEPVLRHLREKGLTLEHILITHFHVDHLLGVKDLHEATGAPVLAPGDDAYLMQSEIGRGGFMGLPVVPEFDYEPIGPGERELLDEPCSILCAPGHTRASLLYYFPENGVIFVGDVLFHRSVGRSDFPGGDHETLLQSVREQIFTLPDDTCVYPGHGLETSVGGEKTHNPFFSEFRS